MMTSAAILKALLALCSPSAAITFAKKFCKKHHLPSIFCCPPFSYKFFHTFALASLAASASAAMARINCSGTRTSFTFEGASILSEAQVVCHNFKWILTISNCLSQFQVVCHNFKWILIISPNVNFFVTSTRST